MTCGQVRVASLPALSAAAAPLCSYRRSCVGVAHATRYTVGRPARARRPFLASVRSALGAVTVGRCTQAPRVAVSRTGMRSSHASQPGWLARCRTHRRGSAARGWPGGQAVKRAAFCGEPTDMACSSACGRAQIVGGRAQARRGGPARRAGVSPASQVRNGRYDARRSALVEPGAAQVWHSHLYYCQVAFARVQPSPAPRDPCARFAPTHHPRVVASRRLA